MIEINFKLYYIGIVNLIYYLIFILNIFLMKLNNNESGAITKLLVKVIRTD